uniref:Ig-like domain-containing protein n=1 Tax=Esox lucius TaxID=8010 RepID=A0AAY5K401_ESOLU
MVVLNTESELMCNAEGFSPPLIHFSWTRAGESVRLSQAVTAVNRTPQGTYRADNRVKFVPLLADQNVTYGCVVTHAALNEPLSLEFKLSFVFLPTVTLSAVPSPSRSAPLTLSCDIEGFYPEDISVSWLQNGTELPSPLPSEADPDGTFRTRRYYTLNPKQRELAGEVECVVHQPNVTKPTFASANVAGFNPVIESVLSKPAKASVSLMGISLVLVFLLCFGFSWRRRDVTEKGPLLPSGGNMGYYKLHTLGPLHSTGDGSQRCLQSSLSFIPQISIHKGAVFKCQVSYIGKDKVVVERVSDKFTILANPEISEIQLQEADDNSGVVTLTIQALHFHPDIITFRWFCQGGELSPVASQALSAPRPDAQGFFSAMSQCKLPRTELERGSTKVWVSVHHVALKRPITRETRGFIKRPHVSEIICSAPSPGQPLTLGCDLTGFYPPDIAVTWVKLRGGEVDDREEEVIDGGEVWGPVLSGPSTYRATATLKKQETKEEKETAGGVVCRVEHCSLVEPIERRWRNIYIAAPSIPPFLTVHWTSKGVAVFSVLLTGGHPKAKVLWAAGGATLTPLVSNQTYVMGEDGLRELKSVCALERSTDQPSQTEGQGQMERQKKRHTLIETEAAVSNPNAVGIRYIDDTNEDNSNVENEMTRHTEEESEEEDNRMEMLHINRVKVRVGPKGVEREPLRVSIEITHPALKLPVYRTWTSTSE